MRVSNIFRKYMIVAGLLGQLAPCTQAYRIFKTGSAADISQVASFLSLFSITSWLVYSLFIKDTPLLVSNILGILGISAVLIGIFLYQ